MLKSDPKRRPVIVRPMPRLSKAQKLHLKNKRAFRKWLQQNQTTGLHRN